MTKELSLKEVMLENRAKRAKYELECMLSFAKAQNEVMKSLLFFGSKELKFKAEVQYYRGRSELLLCTQLFDNPKEVRTMKKAYNPDKAEELDALIGRWCEITLSHGETERAIYNSEGQTDYDTFERNEEPDLVIPWTDEMMAKIK